MMRRMFRREGWVPGAVELTDLALLAKVAHTRRRARWVGECDDAVGVFFVLKGPHLRPNQARDDGTGQTKTTRLSMSLWTA